MTSDVCRRGRVMPGSQLTHGGGVLRSKLPRVQQQNAKQAVTLSSFLPVVEDRAALTVVNAPGRLMELGDCRWLISPRIVSRT